MEFTRTIVKLSHWAPTLDRTGERSNLCITEQLFNRKWRTIYVFEAEPAPFFEERLKAFGAIWFKARFPLTLLEAISIGWKLRCYRPDILEIGFVSKFSPVLPVLKWTMGAKRLLYIDHTSGTVKRRRGLGQVLSRIRGMLAGTYIDRMIAVSEFIRRRDVGQLHLSAAKIQVIHNGVDLHLFPGATENVTERSTRPRVAFAGQLIREKGVFTLLDTLGRLKQRGSAPFTLLIAGQGPALRDLQRVCEDKQLSGDVQFLGQIDWIPRLFAGADVVVVPSEWEEAFGLVVAEAMAAGACVLASDAGGIPEIIGEPGVAGLVFARADSLELADKLEQLLRHPEMRQSMGVHARRRIEQHFTLGQCVDAYTALYEGLCG